MSDPIYYNSSNVKNNYLFLFEDPKDDYSEGYFITIRKNNDNEHTEGVVFYPFQNIAQNYGNTAVKPFEKAIYNYSIFIEQINYTLRSLWDDYIGFDESNNESYNPPFISFDNEIFTLNVDSTYPGKYYDGVTPDYTTEIIFSSSLYKFFNFPAQHIDDSKLTPKNYIILFINTLIFDSSKENPTFSDKWVKFPNNKLLQLKQETKTLDKWYRISYIKNSI